MEKRFDFEVTKVDDEHGMIFGWAIVCTKDGEQFFDSQDDHIPDESMLDAAIPFFAKGRILREMHEGDGQGTVVFGLPATAEILKSLGLESSKTGLIIGVKPDAALLEKAKEGNFTGFSIGGKRVDDIEVD